MQRHSQPCSSEVDGKGTMAEQSRGEEGRGGEQASARVRAIVSSPDLDVV